MPVISVEMKDSVRRLLLVHFTQEPDQRVASQISAVLAKIARNDWPHQWASLFVDSIQLLQTSDPRIVYRGLELLNDILTELTSKRLASVRKEFETGAYSFVGYVYQVWISQIEILASRFNALKFDDEFNFILSLLQLSTQCMNQLLISGIPDLNQSPDSIKFFNSVHEFFKVFVPSGMLSLQNFPHLRQRFEELVSNMSQIVTAAEQTHTVSFRVFVMPFLELFCTQLSSSSCLFDSVGNILCEHYVISCISFLKVAIRYQHKNFGASFSALQGLKFDPAAADK